MKDTVVYVLRHARPADGEMPNRSRPLSHIGVQQAKAPVPYLSDLRGNIAKGMQDEKIW